MHREKGPEASQTKDTKDNEQKRLAKVKRIGAPVGWGPKRDPRYPRSLGMGMPKEDVPLR